MIEFFYVMQSAVSKNCIEILDIQRIYINIFNLKSDHRFNGIPVIMHSSLSSNANRAMGTSVGVDAYVAKFDPAILADTLIPFLQR